MCVFIFNIFIEYAISERAQVKRAHTMQIFLFEPLFVALKHAALDAHIFPDELDQSMQHETVAENNDQNGVKYRFHFPGGLPMRSSSHMPQTSGG